MSKETLQSLTEQIARSKKAVEALSEQLNAKEVAQAKEDATDVRTASIVLAAMAKIPTPIDGKDGKDGLVGSNGSDGIDGVDGKDGVNGKDGINGDTGKTGPTGRAGGPGKDGKDGVGVNGAVGIDGKNGKDGKDGLDGADGADGLVGFNGEDGLNGIDGKDGTNGKDGVAGLRGNDGINGLNGSNGKDGRDGKKGTTGNDGKKGKDGTKGKCGIKGAKGKDGSDGRGISDVTITGPVLKFELTDGRSKRVTLPIAQGAGGGGPVVPDSFQRAARVPFNGKGTSLKSTNVEAALGEVASLIQQSSVGNPFPAGTAPSFLFTFNPYEDTYEATFEYGASDELTVKNIVDSESVVIYTIEFGYTGTLLTTKTITDTIELDSVTISFVYTDGLLTGKTQVYSN